MADAFYPFVGAGPADESTSAGTVVQNSDEEAGDLEVVTYPTRIAIFDDPASAPRVVVIQPKDVRSYLEEITATVTKLAKEQGGKISFTVIREVVENLVHAYFIEPTISILDDGNTIRFSDQGPGIKEKDRALEYGTTSATEQMKKYIRGVGSGLPYAQQYMEDHGGSLVIEDNLNSGTIVTISMPHEGTSFGTGSQQGGTGMGQGSAGQANMVGQQGFYAGQGGTAAADGAQMGHFPMGQAGVVDSTAYQCPGQPGSFQQAGAQQDGYAPQMQNPSYPQQWGQQAGNQVEGYPQQANGQIAGYPQPVGNQAAGYPQQMGGYPMAGYPQVQPQQGVGYPTYQQWGQPMWNQQGAPAGYPAQAGAWQAGQMTPYAGATPQSQELQLSERARNVLAYLAEHESVGPTDLQNAYGESLPTWSRQLTALEEQGIIRKQGQKRYLTEMGKKLL